MQMQSTFDPPWDFTNVWMIDEGNDYPRLRDPVSHCVLDCECDDGNPCNGLETCNAGSCVDGTTIDCSGLDNECAIGTCNPDTGACDASPFNEGLSCDIGLFCTIGKTCASGVCGGGSLTDCSGLGDQCNTGICNETSDACEAQPVLDGTACNDGLFCTIGETCVSGVCNVGPPNYCVDASDQCNKSVCNESIDECESMPVPDGRACNDGQICTVEDKCTAGACSGVWNVYCSSLDNECATWTCNPDTGACEAAPFNEGSGCDDGHDCSTGETCASGVCGGGSPFNCSKVALETVPVGNPGNVPIGDHFHYGGVAYTYNIGKYEVTAGQYTVFLNAVAGVDPDGLYNSDMWSHMYGCKVERFDGSGTVGDRYRYRVAADWADRPVNFVSWADAARFSNWLHNGQPTGSQNPTTTEDGSYDLSATHGYIGPDGQEPEYESDDWFALNDALEAITREPACTWVIPSEDEWYKAAYHQNDGVTGNYFDFATNTNNWPSNALVNPDPGNNATYFGFGGYTIGSPYYRTVFGAHENSDSAYGTFDQTGNVWEWNERLFGGRNGLRGGAFNYDSISAHNSNFVNGPSGETSYYGFRFAEVPQAKSDMDFDGDVDLDDYDLFQDADLHDYAHLQAAFTGPQL